MSQHRDPEASASQPYHSADGYTEDSAEFHLPEDHWPLPELQHLDRPHTDPTAAQFAAVHASPEYQSLRKTFRGFAFPMTIAGLTAYFCYVLLSVYAPEFMAQPAIGAINVGILLSLLQFAITWIWTALYVRFANNRLDPASTALRERLEKAANA